jgi:hypothetical protein
MQYLRPTFFIIGERKCGTSSLYRYLINHPNVLPCALKEPNFFTNSPDYIQQHIAEYWALFPQKTATENIAFMWPELNEEGVLIHEKVEIARAKDTLYISGEASANTFYEVEPSLIKQYLPDIQLIILLRDPVERAFSHHRMYQRFQKEGRDLGFPVQDFKTDILAELALLEKGKQNEFEAYLAPGIYINQLKAWAKVFKKEQIKVYFTADLGDLQRAMSLMNDLQHYLNLPLLINQKDLEKRFNVAPKAAIDPVLRKKLAAFYQPYNEELAAFLGRSLPF